MISDVLSDAVAGLASYQQDGTWLPSIWEQYPEALLTDTLDLLQWMNELREKFDATPA